MNCTEGGAEKLVPVKVSVTEVPCVPCKGENARRRGPPVGPFGPDPQAAVAAIPGGKFGASVIVRGVGERRPRYQVGSDWRVRMVVLWPPTIEAENCSTTFPSHTHCPITLPVPVPARIASAFSSWPCATTVPSRG